MLIAESPERAAQGGSLSNSLQTFVVKHLFYTGAGCFALSGLPLLLNLFPGLTPWAFLNRPFGAGFAKESSARREIGKSRRWGICSMRDAALIHRTRGG